MEGRESPLPLPINDTTNGNSFHIWFEWNQNNEPMSHLMQRFFSESPIRSDIYELIRNQLEQWLQVHLHEIIASSYTLSDVLDQSSILHKFPRNNVLADECGICLEPMQLFQKMYTSSCQHQFHPHCVYNLLQYNRNRCPLCRHSPLFTT